jgi:hypothetical protein
MLLGCATGGEGSVPWHRGAGEINASLRQVLSRLQYQLAVMPGLVPGIHVLGELDKKNVDGRDKPGHDECGTRSRKVNSRRTATPPPPCCADGRLEAKDLCPGTAALEKINASLRQVLSRLQYHLAVMPALGRASMFLASTAKRTWMAGTSPAMTRAERASLK